MWEIIKSPPLYIFWKFSCSYVRYMVYLFLFLFLLSLIFYLPHKKYALKRSKIINIKPSPAQHVTLMNFYDVTGWLTCSEASAYVVDMHQLKCDEQYNMLVGQSVWAFISWQSVNIQQLLVRLRIRSGATQQQHHQQWLRTSRGYLLRVRRLWCK